LNISNRVYLYLNVKQARFTNSQQSSNIGVYLIDLYSTITASNIFAYSIKNQII